MYELVLRALYINSKQTPILFTAHKIQWIILNDLFICSLQDGPFNMGLITAVIA